MAAKAYWVVSYREIKDPAKLAAYATQAGPAIEGAGGRLIVRGNAVKAYEAGQLERTVVVEFDSLEHATATHDSPAYQAAVKILEGGVVRDFRIVPGA
jgi:uncharacterized protein (DUF1330 family)